jgi:hypothetical protein
MTLEFTFMPKINNYTLLNLGAIKCCEKLQLQFSAGKVLKNHFFNKFHRIFCGKSLSMENKC